MVSYSWYGHSVVAISPNLEEKDFLSASLSKASRSRWNSSLEILMQHFVGFLDQIDGWTFADWKECLMIGTDKIRFEYFLGQHGRIRYLRSNKVIEDEFISTPKLQRDVQILDVWTEYIYHVGSPWKYRSIAEGGLDAGGMTTQEGRETCFFTAVYSLSKSILIAWKNENQGCFLID